MNVHQQYESFDEILLLRERCTECCAGSYKSFHCPFCSTSKFKPAKECKLLSHLESHWKNRLAVGNGKYAVKCHLEQCSNEQTGHYHCSICDLIISRKDTAERHFRRCAVTDDNVTVADHQVSEQCDYVADIDIGTGDNVAEKDDHEDDKDEHVGDEDDHVGDKEEHVGDKEDHVGKKNDHVAEAFDEHNYCTFDQEPSRNQTPKETSITKKCQICKKIVSKRWFKSHLKLHMDKNDDINQTRHHHTVMVDICNGVFASSKNISGPFNPVHVAKITSGPGAGIFCEDNKCIEAQQIAKRGRNYSFECPHARSSHYAIQQYEEVLNAVSLENMVDEKILTQDQGHMVQQLQHQAALEHVPFFVFLRNQHSTSKCLFFSVYADRRRYWSLLKRTIVTFDTVKKTLSCRCSSGKRTCSHKTATKWHLYQENMLTSEINDISDSEENESENIIHNNEDEQIERRKLDYIGRHKRYPVTKGAEIPQLDDLKEIIPSEKVCVQCKEKLTRVVLVNRHGKAVLKNKVIHDISVYNKVCSKCGMVYRYQEWSDGLHNYDDSTFIGLDACHLIRAGLQNHVAISRTINMLADTLDENLRLHELTNAYLMFEALTDHSYSFYCYLCGFYPTTLVMDGIRKTCFRHAVSDMAAPADFTELPETVDMDSFWKKVEQELISPGIRHGKRLNEIVPNYEFWAPWIGNESRRSNHVFNTESFKCPKRLHIPDETEPVPDEIIKNLRDEKVSRVRRFCKELGIPDNGSMMDLTIRLREHSIKQTEYDRAYEKIFGTSGGWLIAACPHSVVYAAKSLLRGESPRDFVDLMRSFKHRPNILICDIANRVAASGNKITRMFYPFEGRVAENTVDNIEKAKSGMYTWELGCLNEIGPETTFNQLISNEKNPTSGSSEHYSLFDWFHEDNTKDVNETLRKVSLVEKLGSITNSQVVEQFFNSMRRDLYFINEMSPAVHVFVCRLILQFHNEKSNNIIKKQQSKLFPADMSFNQLGQLCQHFGDEINGIQTSTVGSMEMPDHGSGTVDQQSDIITQHTSPKAACVSDRSSDVVPLHLNELSQIQSALNSSARENYSTFSSLMLSTFEEKIRELTNTWDNLSDEERRAMSLNMDYVTNVLFKCPSERRLSEVASVFVGGHFIQWQGNTNYCGLCAVNNIIGSTADGIFPVLIADMDHIADELWLNMAGDPLVPLTFLIPALRDREGFYSGEVIIKTIERRSYSTTRLQHDVLSATEDNEILDNLMSFNEIKGLIIRKFNEAHWISIPIIDSNFTLIDPKVKAMRTLSSSDVCQLVRSHCFHPGAVYIVQKDTCQIGTDENIESTDVEETGEEIIQNEVKRNYGLRKKPPKKRRTSFWYELDHKKNAKRLPANSVEDNSRNTDEDEHTQNDEEDSSKDTPEISEIDVTQVTWLNKDSPDDTEVGNNEEEEIDEGQYNLESVWLSNIDSALNHILGIMICDDSKCDEVDHERHHEFLRTPNRVQQREHDTYGFGYHVFSEKLVYDIGLTLSQKLLYYPKLPGKPYTSAVVEQIRGLADCKLKELFTVNTTFASKYIRDVVLKEIMIWLLCRSSKCPYQFANNKCLSTEHRVVRKGLRISI